METVRNYREKLHGYNVTYKETDLYIKTESILKKEAVSSLFKYRAEIENYISKHPDFYNSLIPLDIIGDEPDIVRSMKEAGKSANVGPFASVAGAIAEKVSLDLSLFSGEVVVENGGDIFLTGKKDKIVKIFSKVIENIGIKIDKKDLPMAVCSSSAKIGHSLSLGNADLVTVICKKGATADAFATAICNNLKNRDDIDKTIKKFKKVDEIMGCLIIFKDSIAGWGDINIIKIEE